MRSTLTYNGQLPSTGNAAIKHRIRREIHPARCALADTPCARGASALDFSRSFGKHRNDDGRLVTTVDGNDYACLVHPYLRLYVELDILLLRPEPPGALIS